MYKSYYPQFTYRSSLYRSSSLKEFALNSSQTQPKLSPVHPILYLTDSRTLCGTKEEAGQAAMLKDLKALCEASRELCDRSVQQEVSLTQLYCLETRAQFGIMNRIIM